MVMVTLTGNFAPFNQSDEVTHGGEYQVLRLVFLHGFANHFARSANLPADGGV